MPALLSSNSQGIAVRVIQLLAGLATISLLGYAVTIYSNTQTHFGIAIGAISVLYNIVFFILLLLGGDYIVPQVFLGFEVLLTILWLAALIVEAQYYGPGTCLDGYGSLTSTCKAGKGSIGSCVGGFVFFTVTTIRMAMTCFSGGSSSSPYQEKYDSSNMA